MKKIVFLLISLSSFAFAEYTAYAWGYGDIMRETLQVVKYIFSIDEFKDVWRIAVLVSMVAGLFMMMTPNPDLMRLPKIMIISMGVYTIFATAKTDIWVEDKADPAKSGIVTQVPWAVGYPLAFFSTMEYRMGVMYETATSMPEDVKYSNSGFLAPVSIFALASEHRIVTPSLYQNVQNYIIECVVPDIESGWKDYQTLINSDNAWAYIGNTSPSIFLLQMEEDNTQTLTTCPTAYTNITSKLSQYVSSSGKGMEHLGSSLGGLTGSAVYSKYGMASNFLLGTSKSASSLLLQNTTLNMVSESFQKYSMMNGADLGSASFHTAQASAAASAQMVISGLLGVKYIPLMKGILTVVVIGLTPLLMLLMVTPIGVKTLIGYILMLAWLACWHFGDAILNHIIMVKIQNALSIHGEIAFSTQGVINSTITDYINTASAMYWTIPTIALIVVSGFSLASLTSLNSSLTSKLDRTATTAGAGMGSGNINYGNVSHGNYSANKIMATSAVQTGQSFNYSDTAEANMGNSVSNKNGISSLDGQTNINGIGSQNNMLNSVMQSMGTGYNNISSNNLKGLETTDGKTYNASGATISGTNSDGKEFVSQVGQSIWSKNSDGKLSLVSGTEKITEDGMKKEITYEGGKEYSRTVTTGEGSITATHLGNGMQKIQMESVDGKSGFEGIYNGKSGEFKQLSQTIDGVKHEVGKTSSEAIQKSATSKALSELAEQANLSRTSQDSVDNSESKTTALKTNAFGQVTVDTKETLLGGLFAKGTGLSARGGIGLDASYSSDGVLSVKNSEGKTTQYALSGSAREAFEESYSKSLSEEQRNSASRDALVQKTENAINSSLKNGGNIYDTFNNLVKDKDTMYNSINNTGSLDESKAYKNQNIGSGIMQSTQNNLNDKSESVAKDYRAVTENAALNAGKELFNKLHTTIDPSGSITYHNTGAVDYFGNKKHMTPVDGHIPNETENIKKAWDTPTQKTNNNQQNQIEIPKK